MDEVINTENVETVENNVEVVKDTVRIKCLTGVTEQGRLVAELVDGTSVELALMPENGLGIYHSDDVALMAPIYENGVLAGFERYREEVTT